jgi:hypothetical protein
VAKRTLLNRASGGDWPGTLGVRRSALQRTGGYDGSAMFENLELVRGEAHAGEHAADLAHRRDEVRRRRDVPDECAPRRGVAREHVGRRSVDDDQLDARGEPAHVRIELTAGRGRGEPDRHDVGQRAERVGWFHAGVRGNACAARSARSDD